MEFGDLVVWLLGALLVFISIFFRQEKVNNADKFKALYEKQGEQGERITKVETKQDGFEDHVLKAVEEVKQQNTIITNDLTEIKIALAHRPKDRED